MTLCIVSERYLFEVVSHLRAVSQLQRLPKKTNTGFRDRASYCHHSNQGASLMQQPTQEEAKKMRKRGEAEKGTKR